MFLGYLRVVAVLSYFVYRHFELPAQTYLRGKLVAKTITKSAAALEEKAL